jgi:hypothetical protein
MKSRTRGTPLVSVEEMGEVMGLILAKGRGGSLDVLRALGRHWRLSDRPIKLELPRCKVDRRRAGAGHRGGKRRQAPDTAPGPRLLDHDRVPTPCARDARDRGRCARDRGARRARKSQGPAMSRALLVRVRRAKRRRVPPERPEGFDKMSGSQQLAWLIANGVKLADLLGDDDGGGTGAAIASDVMERNCAKSKQPNDCHPEAEVRGTFQATTKVAPFDCAQSTRLARDDTPGVAPAEVELKSPPAAPVPEPPRPPPAPQPRQWWEEQCRWGARGPADYYPDEPED